MGRTFKDSLTYDATNVFLSTGGFAQSVTHYTLVTGSYAGTARNANFEEIGSGIEDTPTGRRFVRRGVLDLPATVTVVVNENTNLCDYFTIAGERWDAIDIPERDEAMISVNVRRDEKVSTKQARST